MSTQDRNYYRQCEDEQLVALANEQGDELSFVLAERLDEHLHWRKIYRKEEEDLIDHYETIIRELKDEIEDLRNNEHIYEG